MNKQLDDILKSVAEVTFESLAFLLPMPEPDDPVECTSTVVTVGFDGPFNGELIVTLPQAVLAELTENMLGLDMGEETAIETQHDAMKELANVVCGNVLPEIAGTTVVFNVAAPVLNDSTTPPSDELTSAARVTIHLDEGPARLELLTQGPIPTDIPVGTA
jgi:CheY-specific phosphatase CheX